MIDSLTIAESIGSLTTAIYWCLTIWAVVNIFGLNRD